MSFLMPKVPKPPLPGRTPQRADATGESPENLGRRYASLISTSTVGLKRKAHTQKRTLIGG